MINKRIISIIISILLLIFGFSYWNNKMKMNKSSEKLMKSLVKEIVKKKSNRGTVILKISSITDFKWDKLYIFEPYTDSETVEKIIGFKWPKAGIVTNDELHQLMIFVQDDEVINYIVYPMEFGYFSIDKKSFTPKNAIFKVYNYEENKGRGGLVLIHYRD